MCRRLGGHAGGAAGGGGGGGATVGGGRAGPRVPVLFEGVAPRISRDEYARVKHAHLLDGLEALRHRGGRVAARVAAHLAEMTAAIEREQTFASAQKRRFDAEEVRSRERRRLEVFLLRLGACSFLDARTLLEFVDALLHSRGAECRHCNTEQHASRLSA